MTLKLDTNKRAAVLHWFFPLGLAVVCPITNEQKGYPWEVVISENDFVSGVVLADQVKSLDWRGRHAEFVCTPEEELLDEVVDKTVALLSPDTDDEE